MFDTLTPDERTALNLKLHGWAHSLYEVGHTLARTALAHDDFNGTAWDYREQYVALRAEILGLCADLAA